MSSPPQSFVCSMPCDSSSPHNEPNPAQLQLPSSNPSSHLPIAPSAKWTSTGTVRHFTPSTKRTLHANADPQHRVQQHLLLRPRHLPNAPALHPLVPRHRSRSPETRQRHPQAPQGQLHHQTRRGQVFLQTRDPALSALRDVDAGPILGRQVALHHHPFRAQRRQERTEHRVRHGGEQMRVQIGSKDHRSRSHVSRFRAPTQRYSSGTASPSGCPPPYLVE